MGLTAPGAKTPSLQQSANLTNQLQLIKDLLSAPITALVDDSSKIKEILEQIESQLPESLQVKLWPAGHLPFFRAAVKAAQQRIELRHSQIPLKLTSLRSANYSTKRRQLWTLRLISPRAQDNSTSWKMNWWNLKKRSAIPKD